MSGALVDVAESVASISDTGFTLTTVWDQTDTYTVETDLFPGGGYYIAVYQNNMLVWDNL